MVSHDLRNTVGTIAAAADLVLELDLPEDREEEQLRIIRGTAERMNRLIKDLLDVSRIEAAALRLDAHPVEITALVHEAVALQRLLASERAIELSADLPGDSCGARGPGSASESFLEPHGQRDAAHAARGKDSRNDPRRGRQGHLQRSGHRRWDRFGGASPSLRPLLALASHRAFGRRTRPRDRQGHRGRAWRPGVGRERPRSRKHLPFFPPPTGRWSCGSSCARDGSGGTLASRTAARCDRHAARWSSGGLGAPWWGYRGAGSLARRASSPPRQW